MFVTVASISPALPQCLCRLCQNLSPSPFHFLFVLSSCVSVTRISCFYSSTLCYCADNTVKCFAELISHTLLLKQPPRLQIRNSIPIPCLYLLTRFMGMWLMWTLCQTCNCFSNTATSEPLNRYHAHCDAKSFQRRTEKSVCSPGEEQLCQWLSASLRFSPRLCYVYFLARKINYTPQTTHGTCCLIVPWWAVQTLMVDFLHNSQISSCSRVNSFEKSAHFQVKVTERRQRNKGQNRDSVLYSALSR